MLYRVDREKDTNLGNDNWKTERYYQYVFGLKNVGKACLNANDADRVVGVEKLIFSFKGLIVCLKKTVSSEYNQTSKKRKKG